MVIKVDKISKQSKPKFISRKKRKELKAIKEVLTNIERPGDVTASGMSPEFDQDPAEQEPEIPAWRLEQETDEPHEQSLTSWTKPLSEMTPRDWKIVNADLGITSSHPSLHPLRSWNDCDVDQAIITRFKEPTPIQAASVPLLLDGIDVVGISPTGSGKTLAFCLPVRRNPLSTLILSPTRELALQTARVLTSLDIANACLIGGKDFALQEKELEGACAIVATPGRLLDFTEQGLLSLSSVTYFVCDEADRMLDMGFGPQLQQITPLLDIHQAAMFTATWADETDLLARNLLKSPVTIRIGSSLNTSIKQKFEWIVGQKLPRARDAVQALPKPCIVFCNTKATCDALEALIPDSVALHSSRSQQDREESLARFKGGLKVLIATDVVGRGIDISGVASVFNYDMPHQLDTYVHRIGRTGRAGKRGVALTFLEQKDDLMVKNLRKLLRDSGQSSQVLDSALESPLTT